MNKSLAALLFTFSVSSAALAQALATPAVTATPSVAQEHAEYQHTFAQREAECHAAARASSTPDETYKQCHGTLILMNPLLLPNYR